MPVPSTLVFLQAVPKDPFFLWQLEVQITNFRSFGIASQMEVVVWHREGDNLSSWQALQQKYPEVGFYFYPDDGADVSLYIPVIRPHALKQHFTVHAERLRDKVFFYHDADIIFNTLPDFEALCADGICWQSDTSSYLDYAYFSEKEKQGGLPEGLITYVMAGMSGVAAATIQHYDRKTGGAQCLLKGIDAGFWQDVEDLCGKIRRIFSHGITGSLNQKYFSSEEAGLQSWCADMWAVNFSLWKRGYTTDITPALAFSWATDSAETYHQRPIYHNAGIASPPAAPDYLFYKGEWIHRSPLGSPLAMPSANTASWYYVQAIKSVQ